MRVDVVWTILRVVFGNEDRRAVPEAAVADDVDKLTNSQVVFGNEGLRSQRPGRGPGGVIVGQAHDLELWQIARRHELVELAFPFGEPISFTVAQLISTEVRVDVSDQVRHSGGIDGGWWKAQHLAGRHGNAEIGMRDRSA